MRMTVSDAIKSGKGILLRNRSCKQCGFTSDVIISKDKVEESFTLTCPICHTENSFESHGTLLPDGTWLYN